MRSALAKALTETGDHTRAERELTTAKRLAERSGHEVLQASILDFRGHLDLDRRRFRDARAAYEGARAAFEALGVTRGVALEDYHLGRALAALGEHDLAVESYVRALDRINPVEDELLLGRTLIYLAESYRVVGDTQAAVDSLNRALEIMRRNGLRYYEARALEVLALLASDSGDADAAAEYRHDAHAIYAALSSPRAQDIAPHLGDPGGDAESEES
jgi:tetratricopeptide (TPR) repeat protein